MERFSYRKTDRLKSRSDYLRCKNGRNRLVLHNIIVSFIKNPFGHARIGCTVTKEKGRAFQRNLFKRRVKEAFRLHEGIRGISFDIHFIPQKRVTEYRWDTLQSLMEELSTTLRLHPLFATPNQQSL